MNKKIIQVIILFIIVIGIVSFIIIDHTGVSQNQAMALAGEHVMKVNNLTKSEISVFNISSITSNGQNGYNVSVLFVKENKTHNESYFVNGNNGNVSLLNKTNTKK
ncbi:MAG: hypothetical protein FWH54_03870 [Methanobrevibacter sp.]|nr:hypothetical protein [Methanobrevibacter sp.]